MDKTVFEMILDGSIPSYKIYEDEFVYAFLDISQTTLGHTLVIPKQKSLSLLETDDETARHVFGIATQLAKHIVQTLDAAGCNILSNAHTAAGQEVPYFHVHIIPRFDENDSIQIGLPSTAPTQEQLQQTQQTLTKNM